jgi:D-xylose transport system permease protein
MTSRQSDTSDATRDAGSDRPAGSFSLDIERRTLGQGVSSYWTRIRSGEPGALPSVLGQVSGRFFSRANIGNLPGQGAYIAVIALGLVFVLLLGEIDLSAGTTGGICAGFAAQAVSSHNLHKGIPTLLFWALIGAMIAALVLGLWLKTTWPQGSCSSGSSSSPLAWTSTLSSR